MIHIIQLIMSKTGENFVTLNDFSGICRICLQSHEEMMDIFKSGMDNQLMEVTNLKVHLDDKLPKTLCTNCRCQMDCLFKFLQLAKSSDEYLRSLLINDKRTKSEESIQKINVSGEKSANRKTRRKRLGKWSRNFKERKKHKKDLEVDKLYLIVVPNVNSSFSKEDSQISIKDLNSGGDVIKLAQLCRSLVKSQLSDHTYPKDPQDFHGDVNDEDQENIDFINSNFEAEDENKIYRVNMVIYECTNCAESFENSEDLSNHYLLVHNCEPPVSQQVYTCPICFFEESNKLNFLNHLLHHKNKGISFIKVNSACKEVFIKDTEKHIFEGPHSDSTNIQNIFLINFESIKCKNCGEKIKSKEFIQEHINSCINNDESKNDFYINYLCPVCNKSSYKDEKSFICHLMSHQSEKVYYIKVNEVGEPVKLTELDELFVPFEDAIEVIKFLNGKSPKIFQIIDCNCCDKCDYEADSFELLSEHYIISHGEKISREQLLSCPVCLEEYNKNQVDEDKVKFYEHLRVHKDEELYFIKTKKNGSLSSHSQDYSDIFTQSPVFNKLVNIPLSSICNKFWCPELVTSCENSNVGYTCDLCQKQFEKKQEVIKHLKSHQIKKLNQDVSNYVCEKCGKQCSTKGIYNKHFLKHSKDVESLGKRPTCSICQKTFANKGTLNGHMHQHLKEGTGNIFDTSLLNIICEKCGKSFSNNASLTKHKKLHAKDKENTVLKCEICNRDFFRQSSFERHKSGHLNPNYFECEVCKLPLSSIMSLQKHLESHQSSSNTFDCKACKVSFLTKDSLTAHQTHTGHYLDRKPLECNVCHEKFYIGRKFTEHIKTHPKYKMGECTLCGKKLSTVQSLMLHMSRHFESNSILCPHCGKQFFEERNYHRHLLTHEGIKPFACDVESCTKSFYTLFELNRHKKYHNNTRDFGCPFCSKSFHEANHLTVHVRTHTGERPYKCPHCNKGFVTRTRCKHHIKLVHQGVGYDLIQSSISKKVTVFEAVEAVV